MLKKLENKLYGVCIVLLVGIVIFSVLNNRNYSAVAEQVLYDLYTYRTDESYATQINDLKKFVSDEVFVQLTSTENLTNLNYILWAKKYTDVKVVEATESYVVYYLSSEGFSESRRFIFLYDTNWYGKIVRVREAELYDFIKYSEDSY